MDDTNLKKIMESAEDVLGGQGAALEWIDKKSATLGGKPRDLANTREGTDRVLLHLAGISRHRFG